MIPKRVMVSGLLLVVAVLAFATLAYQQVPMSTTQESTETLTSYSSYFLTNTVSYVTTATTVAYLVGNNGGIIIAGCPDHPCTVFFTNVNINTGQSVYETQNTATIPYTKSLTESSTILVPASAALGLTDGSFTALAVVVIGILALLTAYVIMKTKNHTL